MKTLFVVIGIGLFLVSCGGSGSSVTTEATSAEVSDTGKVMQAINSGNGNNGLNAVVLKDRAYQALQAVREKTMQVNVSEDCVTTSSGSVYTVTCEDLETESYTCGEDTYTMSGVDLTVVITLSNISIDLENNTSSGTIASEVDFNGTISGGDFSNDSLDCNMSITVDLADLDSADDVDMGSCSCTVNGDAISCDDLESSVEASSCN